ncbi:MAG: hypothetical protein V4547_07445 [Bacteroidota bacterium]
MKEVSVLSEPKIAPSVSLIIPTDKRYPQYRIDEGRVKALVKRAENELLEEFSERKTMVVINKLRNLISTIDHKQLSKALAVFVSSEKEKMIYLPFHVQEKLIIDSSFEIRDLLYSTKNSYGYLLLVIANHHAKVYRGYNSKLIEMNLSNMPLNIEEVKRDLPSKVANFSTADSVKEINLDKYLKKIDDALSVKLNEMDTPVIVCGVQKTLGHFKKLTKNSKKIVAFVEGSYEKSSPKELYKAIEPAIASWRELDQQNSLNKLEDAVNRKEFVYGIEDVWRAAMEKKGRLLIVEKDFVSAAKIGKDEYTLNTTVLNKNDPKVFPDVVDDLIELVLKNDGDIAFVDSGELEKYKGIGLITRY